MRVVNLATKQLKFRAWLKHLLGCVGRDKINRGLNLLAG